MAEHHWHVKNLGDALLASPALSHVEALFEAIYGDSGVPAVFVRHESEGQLHCSVMLYFPPEAQELAQRVQARRCHPPGKDGLSVLVGDEDGLLRWF